MRLASLYKTNTPRERGDVLESNRRRVQNLTGGQLWLFILARVLLAFGVGVLARTYYPGVVGPLAWPAIGVGIILFVLAARGLVRKTGEPGE